MRALFCLALTLAVSLLHAEEIKPSDTLIVPGKRIGLITPGMSLGDLEKAYGKANVKDGELDGPEGTTIPGARLFSGRERELEVVWDEKGKIVQLVRIIGTAWTFENGLKAVMSVEEVEKINGKPFKIFGWGWDCGGSAIIEEVELSGKVMLSFDPGSDEIPEGLVGEVELSSTDPKVRALTGRVPDDHALPGEGGVRGRVQGTTAAFPDSPLPGKRTLEGQAPACPL